MNKNLKHGLIIHQTHKKSTFFCKKSQKKWVILKT